MQTNSQANIASKLTEEKLQLSSTIVDNKASKEKNVCWKMLFPRKIDCWIFLYYSNGNSYLALGRRELMTPELDHVCYTPLFVSLYLSWCVPRIVSVPLIISFFWIPCISLLLFLISYYSHFFFLFELPIFPFPSLQVTLLCNPLSFGHALSKFGSFVYPCIHITRISEHVLSPKP